MTATSFLKVSDGFTKAVPSTVTAVGYCVAFYFLSLALRVMPTGVAYAIWCGVGIIAITVIAWVFQGQRLDAPALAGMALIIAGCVVMQTLSKVVPH